MSRMSSRLAMVMSMLMFGQNDRMPAPAAAPLRLKSPGITRKLWPFGRSNMSPHDGSQERARRRHQIERGQLTGSNGLVVAPRDAR